jgi:hypothetical protein
MNIILGMVITILTFPFWGGAIAVLIGGAFYLALNQPILLVLLVIGLLLLKR